MVEKAGTQFGNWLYKNRAIQENQIDMIRYAIEIISSEFLEMIIIILYSTLSHKVIETVSFLGYFMLLRNLYDGYHAKTIGQCLILTVSVYLFVINVYPFLTLYLCVLLVLPVFIMQFVIYKINQKVIPFMISILLIVLALFLMFIGINNYLQILSLTEILVILSYLLKGGVYEK